MDEVCNFAFNIIIFNKYVLYKWIIFFYPNLSLSNYFVERKWGSER